jgi:hypothetical protein
MAIDVGKFLDEIAAFMAAAADFAFTADAPRQLFTYSLVEDSSTLLSTPPKAASVLRTYPGGSLPYVPTIHAKIQCMTTAASADDDASGMDAATDLFNTLLDSSNRPLRMKALVTYRINGILNLAPPAPMGRDEKNRSLVVFNFEPEFIPIT